MPTHALVLNKHHRETLHASAISDQVIASRGYVSIAPASLHDWRQVAPNIHSDTLLKRVLHQGALAFPIYRCGDPEPFTWILRPDQPREKNGKRIKYEYPAGKANVFDVLPHYRPALQDPACDLWLTEGAKKADALATIYGERIVPLNENGVWGWRSNRKILDDFARIVWEGRRVILAPDGDIRHNKQVYKAVQRTARVLIAKGAGEVLVCLLPAPADQPTLGVDDFLAQGYGPDDLERHLVQLEVVSSQARVTLCKHPTTGNRLYLPPGYDVQHQTLLKQGSDGSTAHLYSGLIIVTHTGRHLHTGEETATVRWNGKGAENDIDIQRADMASSAGCTRVLGGAGAAIHATNAKYISAYLVEFIQENYEALIRQDYTDRLGAVRDGLVLPAGQVGCANQVAYTGPVIAVGTDHDAYPRALARIAQWDQCQALWVTVALSLASPALARLKPDRNPIIYLGGDPSSGKTTIAHFATGIYGNPNVSPLQIQCGSGSTTRVGIQQTLTSLNGVPIFLDDAHVLWLSRPDILEGTIYDFANAQLRTYGGLNNRAQGGHALSGFMLMAGEMVPEFAYGGSQRRAFTIDCRHHLPLGRPRETADGEARAHILRETVRQGAGWFGLAVNERIWQHWDTFVADMQALEQDAALHDAHAWRRLLATAAAALAVGCQTADVFIDHGALMRRWAQMYRETQKKTDPALDAFDRALVMLAQSDITDNAERAPHTHQIIRRATWLWRIYERKMIAAQRVGDAFWRVLSTSPQWKTLVGPGVVDQFGRDWLNQGFVLAHKNGNISEPLQTGRGRFQCVLIPNSYFSEQS